MTANLESSESVATRNPNRHSPTHTANKLKWIEKKISRGRISAAMSSLESLGIADTSNPQVLASVRALYPQACSPYTLPLPDHSDAEPFHSTVDEETLDGILKDLPMGVGYGPFGGRYEHIRMCYEVDHARTHSSLTTLYNHLFAGKGITPAMRMVRGMPIQVNLEKVRPICIAEPLLRVAGKLAMAQHIDTLSSVLAPSSSAWANLVQPKPFSASSSTTSTEHLRASRTPAWRWTSGMPSILSPVPASCITARSSCPHYTHC